MAEMTLEDYFLEPPHLALPTADSHLLWQEDSLAEADLISMRQDLRMRTLGLLIDTRQALQMREGNTAALIVRGFTSFHWDDRTGRSDRLAWKIIGSHPDLDTQGLSLELVFVWPAGLTVVGHRAELYVGTIPGLSEAPPDFVHGAEGVITANNPDWARPFELVTHALIGP